MRRILLLLFLSTQAIAANLHQGEGKFTSIAGDSHEFIKKQLIFEGTKDIVSKELEKLNLNKELFWQKYQEKLDEQLAEMEKNHKESTSFETETNERRKEQILDRLRKKQLVFKRNYLGLTKLLKKFSIRKISRSQKNPNYRYIKLEGQINSNKLTKTYYQLLKGDSSSEYGNLFVRTVFNLKGMTYSDLDIENEKDLRGEVTKNWIEWLDKNKPANISNVESLDSGDSDKVDRLSQMSAETYQASLPDNFKNSLLLEIEINITKESYDDRLKEFKFGYTGNGFLRNLQTNLVIGTYKLGSMSKVYRNNKDINIANIVANHVYQMGKGSLPYIQRNIKDMVSTSNLKIVNLFDFETINQVHTFLKIAESRGVKYSLKAKIDSFSQDQAQALLYFDGDFVELKQLLSSLQSAKKDLSYEVIDGDSQLGIKFNKVVENI